MLEAVLTLSWKKKSCVGFLLFGFALNLVFAIIFNVIIDAIIDRALKEKLTLKNGTLGFELWVEPPVPISFSVYAFDVVNAENVTKGATPRVVERGPYVYQLKLRKEAIVRHDFNSTISYRQIQTFVFDRDASVGSENDTFVTLNIPYFTICSFLKEHAGFVQSMANYYLKSMEETPFVELSIHQLFWGYKHPVLQTAYSVLSTFGISMPFLTGEFGFFTGKNNSDDGLYNVYSGIDGDLSKYLIIDHWNGLRYLDIWSTRQANAVGGSDGSIFPPYVSPKSNLSLFDSGLMRMLPLKYVQETSVQGVNSLRFVVPFDAFGNSTADARNAGFCTPNPNYCLPNGAMNLSRVAHGAPTYVSWPHFVGADQYYFDLVEGLTPDPEKHQTFFDIHPLTGATMSTGRRYQINVRLESLYYFPDFGKVPVSYLPIIWIDGTANMNEKYASVLRDELQAMLDIFPYMRMAIFCISAAFLLNAILLLFCWLRKGKKKDLKKVVKQDPLLKKEHASGNETQVEMKLLPEADQHA